MTRLLLALLALAFSLVAVDAHAQRTGGSFGGARWGSRPVSFSRPSFTPRPSFASRPATVYRAPVFRPRPVYARPAVTRTTTRPVVVPVVVHHDHDDGDTWGDVARALEAEHQRAAGQAPQAEASESDDGAVGYIIGGVVVLLALLGIGALFVHERKWWRS